MKKGRIGQQKLIARLFSVKTVMAPTWDHTLFLGIGKRGERHAH
jgi:hypothetical protein